MRTPCQLAAGLAIALFSLTASAQTLRDPTRPEINDSPAVAKPVAASVRNPMTLQTVVISAERRTAVISGRVMSIGDSIFGFRLAEIREAEVVMKGSKGTRTLRLYPAVNKVASQMATLPETTKGSE